MPRWQMPSFGETKSKQRTEEERKKEQSREISLRQNVKWVFDTAERTGASFFYFSPLKIPTLSYTYPPPMAINKQASKGNHIRVFETCEELIVCFRIIFALPDRTSKLN